MQNTLLGMVSDLLGEWGGFFRVRLTAILESVFDISNT